MSRNRYSLRALAAGCSLLLAAVLASCTEKGNYVNALPGDAALVASVDFGQLAVKGGMDRNTVQPVADMLKKEMPGAGGLVDRIVQDPSESGLGLKDKVYFFALPQASTVGMLARVSDRGKLDELVGVLEKQQLCTRPAEGDGCTWTTMGQSLVAYTDVALLVLAEPGAGDVSTLYFRASALLRQEDGEGFAAGEDFGRLEDSGRDMAFLVSMDLLPRKFVAPLTMGVSARLDLKGVKSFATLNFEDGKIVMEGESVTTDSLMNSLLDKQIGASNPVEGSYLDLFPANTRVWMTANADGAKIYSLLCENPTMRRQFENSMMPIDFELIFSSIRGDMALAMPAPLASGSFIAYADVTGNRFLQTFEELKPLLSMTGGMMKLVNKGEDEYEFRIRDGSVAGLRPGAASFWFGVKDGRFYVTNDHGLVDAGVRGLTLRNCAWGSRVEGKRFFMAMNLSDLPDGGVAVGGMAPAMPFIGLSDHFMAESSTGRDFRMEWVMKDRKTNALKQIASIK